MGVVAKTDIARIYHDRELDFHLSAPVAPVGFPEWPRVPEEEKHAKEKGTMPDDEKQRQQTKALSAPPGQTSRQVEVVKPKKPQTEEERMMELLLSPQELFEKVFGEPPKQNSKVTYGMMPKREHPGDITVVDKTKEAETAFADNYPPRAATHLGAFPLSPEPTEGSPLASPKTPTSPLPPLVRDTRTAEWMEEDLEKRIKNTWGVSGAHSPYHSMKSIVGKGKKKRRAWGANSPSLSRSPIEGQPNEMGGNGKKKYKDIQRTYSLARPIALDPINPNESPWSHAPARALSVQHAVTRVRPSVACVGLTKEVFIEGKNFVDCFKKIRVRLFDSKHELMVPGAYVDKKTIKCAMPTEEMLRTIGKSGILRVELSLNGKVFNGSPQAVVAFFTPAVSRVIPASGPAIGGHDIYLDGSFAKTDNMAVGFCLQSSPTGEPVKEDWHLVPAKYLSETQLVCTCPSFNTVGFGLVKVAYSPDGKTLSKSRQEYYCHPPRILQISPTAGPLKGGIPISLYGDDFPTAERGDDTKNGRVKVKFTQTSTKKMGEPRSVIVDGKIESDTHLTCELPDFSEIGEGLVTAEVSFNHWQFTNHGITFRFSSYLDEGKAVPFLSSVTPMAVDSVGGVECTLVGVCFDKDTTLTLTPLGGKQVSVVAKFESSEVLKFQCPNVSSHFPDGGPAYIQATGKGQESNKIPIFFRAQWEWKAMNTRNNARHAKGAEGLEDWADRLAGANGDDVYSCCFGNRIVVFGGSDEHNPDLIPSKIMALDIAAHRWHCVATEGERPMRSAFVDHPLAVFRTLMFLFGNLKGKLYHAWTFGLQTLKWENNPHHAHLTCHPVARTNYSVACKQQLHILFGKSVETGEGLDDCWTFNPLLNAWKPVKFPSDEKRPSARWNHSSTVMGSHVIVFGGESQSGVHNDVWILHVPYSSTSSLYSYDEEGTDVDAEGPTPPLKEMKVVEYKWTEVKTSGTPPPPRHSHWHSASLGRILITNGEGSSDSPVGTELYSLDTRTWSWSTIATKGPSADPRPFGRGAHDAVGGFICFGARSPFLLTACDTRLRVAFEDGVDPVGEISVDPGESIETVREFISRDLEARGAFGGPFSFISSRVDSSMMLRPLEKTRSISSILPPWRYQWHWAAEKYASNCTSAHDMDQKVVRKSISEFTRRPDLASLNSIPRLSSSNLSNTGSSLLWEAPSVDVQIWRQFPGGVWVGAPIVHHPTCRYAGTNDDKELPAAPCSRCKVGVILIRFQATDDENGLDDARVAIHEGEERYLQQRLRHPALPINKADQMGRTLLHEAVDTGSPALVATLLAFGADPSLPDWLGNTPYHQAALRLQADTLKVFGSAPWVVNLQNKSGDTAGHIIAHRLLALAVRDSFKVRLAAESGWEEGVSSNNVDENASSKQKTERMLNFASIRNFRPLASQRGLLKESASAYSPGSLTTKMSFAKPTPNSNLPGDKPVDPSKLSSKAMMALDIFVENSGDMSILNLESESAETIVAPTKSLAADAVRAGDMTHLMRHCRLGPGHVNHLDVMGRSALHEAAEFGRADMATKLFEAGCNYLQSDAVTGKTPVHVAAQRGHLKVLQALCRDAASVAVFDSQNRSPLHAACEWGQVACALFLLDLNPDMSNHLDTQGRTPLHSACALGLMSLVKALCESGADVDKRVETEIKVRVKQKHADPDDEVAPPEARNRKPSAMWTYVGHNYMSHTPLLYALQCERWEVVSYLLSVGADPDVFDNFGRSCLEFASSPSCPISVFEDMIQLGADTQISWSDGTSLLAVLAGRGDVRRLVQVLSNDSSGLSTLRPSSDIVFHPIVAAAAGGWDICLKQLCKHSGQGTTPTATSFENDVTSPSGGGDPQTPFSRRARKFSFARSQSVQQLWQSSNNDGEQPDSPSADYVHLPVHLKDVIALALIEAAKKGSLKCVLILCKRFPGVIDRYVDMSLTANHTQARPYFVGPTPTTSNTTKVHRYSGGGKVAWTAAHAAAAYGNLGTLQILHKLAADFSLKRVMSPAGVALNFVNDEPQGRFFDTAVHCALENGNDEAAAFLLQNAPRVDEATVHREDSKFALHLACERNCKKSLELLGKSASHQQRHSDQDLEGRTPLHYAVLAGDERLVSLLLKHTPVNNILDNRMCTAMRLASTRGFANTMLYLALRGGEVQRKDIALCELRQKAMSIRNSGSRMSPTFRNLMLGGLFRDRDFIMPVVSQHLPSLSEHETADEGSESMDDGRSVLSMHSEMSLRSYKTSASKAEASSSMAGVRRLLPNLSSPLDVGRSSPLTINVEGAETHRDEDEVDTITHLLLGRCLAGDVDMVNFLVASGCNVNEKEERGMSSIAAAAKLGHTSIVTLLAEKGAEVEPSNPRVPSPLTMACGGGHVNTAKVLTQKGADIERSVQTVTYMYDCSPLGTNVEIPQHTALHAACMFGHMETVRMLTSYHADVNNHSETIVNEETKQRNIRGSSFRIAMKSQPAKPVYVSALHLALINAPQSPARTQKALEEVVTFEAICNNLIDCKADLTLADPVGRTPLHIALRKGYYRLAARMAAELDGATIQRPFKDPYDLHVGVESNNEALVTELIDSGMDVNQRDDRGRTPLHRAVIARAFKPVYLLLESDAEIDLRDYPHRYMLPSCNNGSVHVDYLQGGRTALHYAAGLGDQEMVELLIEFGAEISVRDNVGMTPLMVAAAAGQLQTVMYLSFVGAELEARTYHPHRGVKRMEFSGYTAAALAIARGQVEVGLFLLRKGADPLTLTDNGDTLLHLAMQSLDTTMAGELVKYMPNEAFNVPNLQGFTPYDYFVSHRTKLQHRMKYQELKMERSELWKSIEWPISADRYIHDAARLGRRAHLDSLQEEEGEDPDVLNSEGWSPLMLASCNGHNTCVNILVRNGVDVEAELPDGRTALWLAIKHGHENIVVTLLTYSEHPALQLPSYNLLHWVGFWGMTKVCVYLMESQKSEVLDPNAKDEHGHTPMDYALAQGHLFTAKAMAEIGAAWPEGWDPEDEDSVVRKRANQAMEVYSQTKGSENGGTRQRAASKARKKKESPQRPANRPSRASSTLSLSGSLGRVRSLSSNAKKMSIVDE